MTKQQSGIAITALAVTAAIVVFSVLANRYEDSGVAPRSHIPESRQSPVVSELKLFLEAKQPQQPAATNSAKTLGTGQQQDTTLKDNSKARDNANARDWSVVAATLNSPDAAERRARNLQSLWKDCGCTVFPKGESARYFVVVGTDLDRQSADRLRDRATAAGLPGDTYVTKLYKGPPSEIRTHPNDLDGQNLR